MSWKLSKFRTGDLVEVRSKEEILATLDQDGCVEGMPFMPEMLQYCGQRVRVSGVAHKTCETARKTWKGRRLQATVHLAGLRCDGSAHGGCQADCNLFWKDAWLKPIRENSTSSVESIASATEPGKGCTEARLGENTTRQSDAGSEVCYSCQATRVTDASEPLPWWDLRQYCYDVVTRNRSARHVIRVLWLASLREVLGAVPMGYRLCYAFAHWMHRLLTGRGLPAVDGKVKRGTLTPTGRLDLVPGEYVRVKSQSEIEETLDEKGNNRGLSFDPEEMAGYCNRVFKVRGRVSRIIDELTGKMLEMKQPCITMENVVCRSEYARCRVNCPRSIPSFWRELWLERIDVTEEPQRDGNPERKRIELAMVPMAAGGKTEGAGCLEGKPT